MSLADHRRGLREGLRGPLDQLTHELLLAQQMAQGPDPEEAIAVLRSVHLELTRLLKSLRN